MNKLMRKYWMLAFALLFGLAQVTAQTSEYRSILDQGVSGGKQAYLKALKNFQYKYPTWPNTYYKIAEVQMDLLKEMDPLVDRFGTRQYLYNAQINYGLASNYVDEKEALKNYAWYNVPAGINRDSIPTTIVKSIKEKYRQTSQYMKDYELLLDHFDRAVSNYLEARELFIDINTRADNLRVLFLTADDKLKKEVKQVGISFDSTLYHLEQYKAVYQRMPHSKKRNSQVQLNPIDHYRMSGITPTNFLSENLLLWDYKYWSENFTTLIEHEVDGLKDEISGSYETFSSINKQMSETEECMQVNVDNMKFQRVINLVSKYDNQSQLIDLFHYLMSKLEFDNQVVYNKNCQDPYGQPTDHLLSRRVRSLQDSYSAMEKADSLNRFILESGHEQSSFQWFFDKYLPGRKGIDKFVEGQTTEVKTATLEEIDQVLRLHEQQYIPELETKQMVVGNGETLQLAYGEAESGAASITRKLALDSLHSLVVLEKANDLTSLAAVRQIEEGYQMVWEVLLPKGQKPEFLKVMTDSTFIVAGSSPKGWFKHLNYQGVVLSDQKISKKAALIDLYNNDLLGSYVLIQELSADTINQTYKYQLTELSSSGSVSGTQEVELSGNFITMTTQEGAYWFFSHSQVEGHSEVQAKVLDKQSKTWSEPISYVYAESLSHPVIIKNDNLSLTLIARKGEEDEKTIYSIIDYNGAIQDQAEF